MTKNLLIEWFVTNSCNFNCWYCPSHLKDGQLPAWPLDKLYLACQNISNQATKFEFDSVKIQVNGGEPTHSESFRQLLESNLDPVIQFKLITNGSASLEWWHSISHKVCEIDLTYHLNCDLDHFKKVIERFLQHHRMISIRVPMPLDQIQWDMAYKAFNQLLPYELNPEMVMLYKNLTRGSNQYLDYTKQQWDTYFEHKGVETLADNLIPSETIEYKKVNRLNDYYGHLCYAGVEQAVINYYGDVFRGWCFSNSPMGNVFSNTFELNPKPLPCPKSQCGNGFDLKAKKSEKSWGMS